MFRITLTPVAGNLNNNDLITPSNMKGGEQKQKIIRWLVMPGNNPEINEMDNQLESIKVKLYHMLMSCFLR